MGLKQYQKIIISMSLIVVSVFADNLPNQTIVDEVQGYKYIDISKTDINSAYNGLSGHLCRFKSDS